MLPFLYMQKMIIFAHYFNRKQLNFNDMKKLIFIALAIFIAFETSAQLKIGIKGGWDFENFDIGGSIGEQLKTDKSTSWNLGAAVQVKLSGNLYLP